MIVMVVIVLDGVMDEFANVALPTLSEVDLGGIKRGKRVFNQ